MKAVLGIAGLLAVLGVVYGLAFVGIIPTKKLAAKSPAWGKALIALHLAKPTPKTVPAAVAAKAPAAKPSPEKMALDAEKQQLAAERAQLDKARAALATQQQQASAAAPAPAADPSAPPAPDAGAKLVALYGTMDPDDLVRIFAQLPDPLVVHTLMQMDEKKAGQVFAALPADRAARLSRIMASHPPGASGVNCCRPCSGDSDSIASVFSRLWNPVVTDTPDFGTPSRLATNAQQAAFAAPATGGAVSRRCSTPASYRRTWLRDARGITRT